MTVVAIHTLMGFIACLIFDLTVYLYSLVGGVHAENYSCGYGLLLRGH